MVELVESLAVEIVSGLIGAGVLSALVWLYRKVGPEPGRRFARTLGWPILAFTFFASATAFSIYRRATGTGAIVLAALLILASAIFLLFRFGPERVRLLGSKIRVYAWPILAGFFFLCSVSFYLSGTSEPIKFVIGVAHDEYPEVKALLEEIESELGTEIDFIPFNPSRFVEHLDQQDWDVIAVDINMLGQLKIKQLQELPKNLKLEKSDMVKVGFGDDDPFQDLLKKDGMRSYLAPLRLNVKIGFSRKLEKKGIQPPESLEELLEVAKQLKDKKNGRVVIQGDFGRPGIPAAITLLELIMDKRWDPEKFSDQETRKVFETLRELGNYLHPEWRQTRYDTANLLLDSNEIDLVSNWTFAYKVVDAKNRNMGVYRGWQKSHVLGGEVLVVPKGAPHPKQAFKLIKLLRSPEIQKKLAGRLCWIPVLRDAFSELENDLEDAVRPALDRAVVRPPDPEWYRIEEVLAWAFKELMNDKDDKKSIDFIIDECKKKFRK